MNIFIIHAVIPGVWVILSHVASLLESKGHHVVYMLDGWSKNNKMSGICPGRLVSLADFPRLVADQKALLIYGTRTEMSKNQELLQLCSKHDVTSLFVADSCKINPGEFEDPKGGVFFPDAIAVVNEFMKKRFLKILGSHQDIFQNILVDVIGWPALDNSVAYIASLRSDAVKNIRRRYLKSGRLALFVTEPVRSDYQQSNGIDLGYDEFSILAHYFSKFASNHAVTVIKLHPRQDVKEFMCFLRESGWMSRFQIFVEQNESIEDLIAAADVVYGMTSIALHVAIYAGKQVISIQSGRTHHGEFLSNPCLESRLVL